MRGRNSNVYMCIQVVCMLPMTTTTQKLMIAHESVREVQNEVSAPVCKPVMRTLRSMLSESDKIDVSARRLIALAVHADQQDATDIKHGSSVQYVGLDRVVDSRSQLLRDQNDRLVGFPAITGG